MDLSENYNGQPPPTPLVPMRFVEVLDRTFRIYRENFVTVIILAAAVTIPITLLGTVIREYQPDITTTSNNYSYSSSYSSSYQNEVFAWWGILILVMLLNFFLQGVLLNGIVTYIASESHLGRKITIAEAFSAAKSRLGVLALALFVFGIIVGGLALVVTFTGIMCFIPLLFMPAVLYFGLLIYFFIFPVMMLERVGVFQGINRSIALGKIKFWRVLGFFFSLWLISLIISIAFEVLVILAVGTTSYQTNPWYIVLNTIMSAFVAPILPIGFTVMYYDIRVRFEGLDFAFMLTKTQSSPRPADVISPRPMSGLLTSQDVLNIVVLTGGSIAIGLVLFIGMMLLVWAMFSGAGSL